MSEANNKLNINTILIVGAILFAVWSLQDQSCPTVIDPPDVTDPTDDLDPLPIEDDDWLNDEQATDDPPAEVKTEPKAVEKNEDGALPFVGPSPIPTFAMEKEEASHEGKSEIQLKEPGRSYAVIFHPPPGHKQYGKCQNCKWLDERVYSLRSVGWKVSDGTGVNADWIISYREGDEGPFPYIEYYRKGEYDKTINGFDGSDSAFQAILGSHHRYRGTVDEQTNKRLNAQHAKAMKIHSVSFRAPKESDVAPLMPAVSNEVQIDESPFSIKYAKQEVKLGDPRKDDYTEDYKKEEEPKPTIEKPVMDTSRIDNPTGKVVSKWDPDAKLWKMYDTDGDFMGAFPTREMGRPVAKKFYNDNGIDCSRPAYSNSDCGGYTSAASDCGGSYSAAPTCGGGYSAPPTYTAPGYTSQIVYQAPPVYRAPVYRAPAYRAYSGPVYGGVGAGINFFGLGIGARAGGCPGGFCP